MAEYIDKQKLLIEAVQLSGPMTGDGWDNLGVYALIDRQPAVDVSEVVHCHDCKFFSPLRYDDRTDGFCLCEYLQLEVCVQDNFYCAYGERRADNDT